MKIHTKEDAYTVGAKGKQYEVQPFTSSDTQTAQFNIFEDGGEFLFSLIKDASGNWQTDCNTEHPESGDNDFDQNLPFIIGKAIDKKV